MLLHSIVSTLYPWVKIFHWLPIVPSPWTAMPLAVPAAGSVPESEEHGILFPASIYPFSPSDSLTAARLGQIKKARFNFFH